MGVYPCSKTSPYMVGKAGGHGNSGVAHCYDRYPWYGPVGKLGSLVPTSLSVGRKKY